MSNTHLIDPLVASWHETVQALPTVEEREELSHFIRHDLREGVGAGILRGLFLLLKANRLYLEQLPDKYNQELVQPMRDLLLRWEKSVATQIETQKLIAAQNERTSAKSFEAMECAKGIVPKVESAVQVAVDKIDTEALSRQITATVIKSTVEPVACTNEELRKMIKLLMELIEKIKEAIDVLLRISWRKMFVGSLGISFCIWAAIFFFVYQAMQHSFADSLSVQNQKLQNLAGAISKAQGGLVENQTICDELSRLQVTIDVRPIFDGEDRYQLIVSKAYDAKVLPNGTGAISFQGADLTNLILRQIEENAKLSHH